MENKKYLILIISGILLISIASVIVDQYYRLKVCNFKSLDGCEHCYYIYPDTDPDSLVALLRNDYHIGSYANWRLHSRFYHFNYPQTGYYKLPARMGDQYVIRRLMLGQQTPIKLTFNNSIRTTAQLSRHLGKHLLLDSAEIDSRFNDASYLQQYNLSKEEGIALFLPNTYEVYWTISADKLFERMNREYHAFWNDNRLHKADSLHLNPVQIATLASIIESETNKKQEYPLIASLYLNRLRIGMHLQACPTVIYATGNFKLRRVLKQHLKIDSPYNTYKYAGLPPGPIRCAYASTMDAILNAPKTDYLYMCANSDWSGTHIFSSTYAKHAAAARAYQKELNRRKIGTNH